MNVKEKDLVHKALTLAESVGERVASGYWLADGSTPGQLPSISNSYAGYVEADGIYLALTSYESTYYYRATDGGTSWTRHSFPGNLYRRNVQIVYGQGVFVGKQSGDNKIYYSSDGISWTAASIPSELPDYNEILLFGQNAFWVFGTTNNEDRNKTVRSTDGGKTWQTVGQSGLYNSSTTGADGFAYDQDTDTFCSVCANECVYTSKNGINWSQLACSDFGIEDTICAGGGYLVYGTSGSYMSSYGLEWHDLSTGENGRLSNKDFFGAAKTYIGSGKFLILGSQGSSSRVLYEFDTSTRKVSTLTSLSLPSSGDGIFIGSMGEKLIAYVAGDTYYGLTPTWWSADLDASLVDNNGTDKTVYVINAITGVIQTNTLDAAYTAGVNAYQGE